MPRAPTVAPKPAPAAPKGATVVRTEDLEQAKDEALLQLNIGRTAHLYAVGVSGALALDGILLLLFYSHLPSLPAGATGLAALGPTFYLLIPVLAGLAIAAVGLLAKWEAYQLWPWETHFSVTVGALGLNVLAAVFYGLRVAGSGPFAHDALYPGFFPLEIAAISAALLGLTMTWPGWGSRQWAAAACAVIPFATSIAVFAQPSATGSGTLVSALFLSAVFYQMSGSLLHLISSGTRPHEKELISAGQNRIVRLADETRQKEEALRFRETALVRREADVENAQSTLQKARAELDQATKELDQRAVADHARAEELDTHERELAGRAAEVEGIARALEARVRAIEMKEQEVGRHEPQLAAREERAVQREAEHARREAEIVQREQELEGRLAAASESESRLVARKKQIDEKTAELLRREGEVTHRGGRPAPPVADAASDPARLRQLKAALDEQNAILGRRAREVTEREAAVKAAIGKMTERQSTLAAREAALAQREAGVSDRLKAADERKVQYESAARDYQKRLDEVSRQQVDAAQRRSDLDRSEKTIGSRESVLSDREQTLRAALAEIDQREKELLARERTVEAHEAELSLRRQEAERGDMTLAGLAAIAAADRAETPPPRTPSRPPRPAARTASTPEAEGGTGSSGLLSPPTGRRYTDRLPSGIPRLDDLLLGGLPARGHVVLLGDAFVGKEVVLYSFVAEGLKRGEPIVLVTASRSPAELSESLGVVLPQFREYEQLGMVTWIDASTTGAVPSPKHLVTRGSDDRAGILSALVQAARSIEQGRKGPFRVGFLGLSAVLAHADERASFSFLQNVVGILKPRDALAMYSLEGGALTEAQVESLLGRMDGAIVFRQDRDRTFLSVRGFGDVQTREWIECRASNRALVIGSFALERIR